VRKPAWRRVETIHCIPAADSRIFNGIDGNAAADIALQTGRFISIDCWVLKKVIKDVFHMLFFILENAKRATFISGRRTQLAVRHHARARIFFS
jgi:hypothetical protein